MKLSVIIPGYNTPERWWRRCLESVLAACRGFEFEIICVDDGSKVKPVFLEEFPVRVVYLEQNRGQSTARNEALGIAQGEYITFVDSDDEVKPDVYVESFKRLDEYGADIAIFGVKVVWVNDALQRTNCLNEADLGVLDGNAIREIFDSCLFEYPVNKLYRRDFLDKYGICFDPRVCPGEDTVFNLQFVKHQATWCTVPCVGYVYYRYDGSSLSRYFPDIRYSVKAKADAWAEVSRSISEAEAMLEFTRYSEKALDCREWRNMWRRASPISYADRWKFLAQHRHLARYPRCVEFVWQFVYSFLRRKLYIRPIRRWHIKRMYPNVQEVCDE